MAQIVRMPSVMANETDAVLSEWLTELGASIAIGEPLAAIETDKAVVEYAAEVDGTIGRFLVEPGTTVAVGEPILVVLAAGEDVSAIPANGAYSPAPAELDEAVPKAAEPRQPAQVSAAAPSTSLHPETTGDPKARLIATPIARRAAAQCGIDLALVTGTGPNGRIVRRDIDAYTATQATGAVSATPASTADGHTDIPLTKMRRAIAKRLTESTTTVPHFYVTAHVRADRLLVLRQEVNSSSPRKISVNDLVVKAVAAALVDVPAANAIWNGDSIRHFEGVDVAVAVAVPEGLLTPVVRGVQGLGIVELSGRIAQLADGARSGRLQQHQLEGGSFTVSNLGMYGVDAFSAILNPPQAGILAVSAAKPQPVVGDDGELSVGTVMTMTLSADHRVIDGAIAAEWIAALVSRLENPIRLLL